MQSREQRAYKAVGLKVQALRRARGLTLAECAALARMGMGALSEIENGKRDPRLGTLTKLARVLKVSRAELVG